MAPTALKHRTISTVSARPIRMLLTGHDTEPVPEPSPEPEPAPDPEPNPTEPATVKPGGEPVPDPRKSPEDGSLGDGGQKALATEREARKVAEREAREAKAAREAAEKRVQEFEDEKKTELERAQAAAERAAKREQAANLRAVTSELRSAAIAADAQDPALLVELLAGRSGEFLTEDGIDVDAIEAAVTARLEASPFLRKPAAPAPAATPASEPPKKTAPKPDPGQGSGRGSKQTDFMTATDAEVEAELAAMGITPRR